VKVAPIGAVAFLVGLLCWTAHFLCKEATLSANRTIDSKATRQEKRARFNGNSSGASPLILIIGLLAVLAVIGGALFALTRPAPPAEEAQSQPNRAEPDNYSLGDQDLLVSSATHGHAPFPLVVESDGKVRLSLDTFDDYMAHYYTYMHQGRPIEFFVLKSKDGVVRAAFNACDVCYLSKKGYTQDGDYVICNNCGQRFPADGINDVHGGCNPSPLARVVDGDTLVILVEDIVQGLRYF
jgi:hypothetical protein